MPSENQYNEDQRKYFDFLQSIITRMNSNSFVIKGWAITIISAIIALSASTKEPSFLFVAALPLITFWILDTIYLQQERKFRSLYNEAAKTPSGIATFDLNINKDFINQNPKNQFWDVFISKTILPIYLATAVIVGLGVLFIDLKASRPKEKTTISITDTLRIKNL